MFSRHQRHSVHRARGKSLGVLELVAIALGGMVGGGIFTILGVAVSLIGVFTPVAILLGGGLAALAAYSYIKLGVYFQDEGATYAFIKRAFPNKPMLASLIGWWVIFGYISTLSLYAYTFSTYALHGLNADDSAWIQKLVAGAVITVFMLVNIWSVSGMGKIEDIMVYTKLVILAVIAFVLINNASTGLPQLMQQQPSVSVLGVLVVASITFVAYEGFQLVINAVNEMDNPSLNVPRAIYSAIVLATLIYAVIAIGAIVAIPQDDLIRNKEYALAAGASETLGHWGTDLIILGALLATSSAISGTVFGASRQLAVIASDGYMPAWLGKRRGQVPANAIIAMSLLAFALILLGDLQQILEFGSVTFLLVSLLIAVTNAHLHRETGSSRWVTWLAVAGLAGGTSLIIAYEATEQPMQLTAILILYALLSTFAWLYARISKTA